MYIKSVIIDGFKSYGKRTEILGFDHEFTAITGLNGTGKSNVLDAICFVLGISNLGQVRATSLQELVYKGGQCGVTKATVTLVFDNTNPAQFPIGYEKCREIMVSRQVVVGGKNKYMINGKAVINKKVSDLFCSVQLNINNPNFLIMQGRITKVLNMKPAEILSMVEEAAGTGMYESKRDETQKLLRNKDSKMNEINSLLDEVIHPKLEKLRGERERFLEFQKIGREIEYLTRIHISNQYLLHKKSVSGCEASIAAANDFIEASNLKMIANDQASVQIDQECQLLQEKIDKESGGELKGLEAELAKKSTDEATASAARKSVQAEIQTKKRQQKSLEKVVRDDEVMLGKKEAEMGELGGLFESLKQADERDTKAFEDAKKKFEEISSGLATNEDGQAASLQDQLITAKQQLSEAGTTMKQADMEIKHCTTKLRTKQGELKSNDTSYAKDKKALDNGENEVKKLQANLSKIDYQEGLLEELEEQRRNLQQQRREVQTQFDRKNGHRFEFQYRDPEANFDRRRVKGMVCMLFDVRDNRDSMALSMCAGGSLYSVATDTDVTSKLILQKGQLQTRTTMVPINKVSASSIPQSTVKFAQSLVGAENVNSAMALIAYDPSVERVMQFVFGNTLICKDIEIAKKVTYHPNIMCRSVTLDGDVVDPQGTLSGGARPKGGSVLLEISEIKKLLNTIQNIDVQLKSLNEQIARIQRTAQTYNQMKEQLDLQQHELNNVRQRLQSSTFQQQQTEIDELQKRIEILQAAIVTAKETEGHASAKAKDIEAKLRDAKGYRERELKSASEAMKKTKQQSDQSQKKWKQREQEYETLRMEIEEIKTGISTSKEQLQVVSNEIEAAELKSSEMVESNKDLETALSELRANIKRQKEAINSQHKELRTMIARKDKMGKESQDLQLDIKKRQNEITKLTNENKDGLNHILRLENSYPWIEEDRQFFGAKNTRYDYTKTNPKEAAKKLETAQEAKKKIEMHINQKAMMMLEREEQQFNNMEQRKHIVDKDKDKITSIIGDLDEQKKKEVKKAWLGVSQYFGSIFETLLPGAQASLIPAQGDDFLTGLVVKVGFNGMWKESLNELSGGQRSLVALSLILAMLKFKPAPLYILDEVDAALDMSHTQNIGNMLKKHFTNSQFIIVSLKDGMFNNANVLFKTKFVDGVSAVTRTVASRR